MNNIKLMNKNRSRDTEALNKLSNLSEKAGEGEEKRRIRDEPKDLYAYI